MNTLHCQDLQARLLELKAAGLSEAERAHLRECPACRDFAQDVIAPGTALTALAHQMQRQAPAILPPDLKNRVLGTIRQKLENEARDAAAASQAAQAPANGGKPPREWTWGALLNGLTGHWQWAAACALLLCVTAVSINTYQGRPIGRLEFASGLTSLIADSMHRRHEGVGNWQYGRGATLNTEAQSAAIFSIGADVRVAMAGDTELKILSKTSLELKTGSVWLSVNPGGKGFKVETPHGLVQVTGTHFGVEVTSNATKVEVTKGSVAVSQGASQGNVTAGNMLTSGAAGVTAATPRPTGLTDPGWVTTLLTTEQKAQNGNWLPSIGKNPNSGKK